MLKEVRHIKMCGDRRHYCGHPRQGGIFNFGDGEIAVIHFHAPCSYTSDLDVKHNYGGYHSRAVTLLQRSLDNGETWSEENNTVLFDETPPLAQRRRFLFPENPVREELDMSSPDAVFFFGRSFAGTPDERGVPGLVCFCLRSDDRGRSWENVPTIVSSPGPKMFFKDNHPVVRMPDGSFLGAFTMYDLGRGGIALYGTDDDGLTWDYVSEVARDPSGFGRPTYAGLVLLPSGRLQCYMLNLHGVYHALAMNYSDDGGYSWSVPRPIVRWGHSPWRSRRPKGQYGGGGVYVHYRSPWPLLLRDGRILVIFARRKPPFGIGLIISEDMGQTWSRELIIRDDASGVDIGYPVATELEDGHIFTAYYYTLEDGNNFGGSRFIGATFFRV